MPLHMTTLYGSGKWLLVRTTGCGCMSQLTKHGTLTLTAKGAVLKTVSKSKDCQSWNLWCAAIVGLVFFPQLLSLYLNW